MTDSEKMLINIIYADKPIKEFVNSEMPSVIQLIGRWRYAIGLSKECDADDLVTMSFFIKENYGFLNVSEIDHAIKLSITGKLGLDSEEVNPFNNFSFLYVGKILNAYLEYKKSLFRDITKRRDEAEIKQIAVPKPTPEEMAETMKEIIAGEYQKWKSSGEILDPFNIVYNYFKKTNQAAISKEQTELIKAQAKKKAKETKEKNTDYRISFSNGMNEESLYIMYGKNLCTQYIFSKIEDIDKFLNTITAEHFTDDTNG